MRGLIARAFALVCLMLLGAAAPLRAQSVPYLFVPLFETKAGQTPGSLDVKGVVANFCGARFGAQTYFQISYDGEQFEIPVSGLAEGQELQFTRTLQVSASLRRPATFDFEFVVPSPNEIEPNHYVSPCVVTFVKPPTP